MCIQILCPLHIFLYSTEPIKKCCKKIGVPDICYKYCIEKSSGSTRLVTEQICKMWFGRIGACQEG